MRPFFRLVLITSLGLATSFIVVPLSAQYNPPGGTVVAEGRPEEEELRQQMEKARLRLGVLRLQPWIGVRDASIVTAAENEDTDLTLSVGAGLRGYVKMGRKWIGAAHILPEYIWWQKEEDRRSWGGRFGLGAFAFYNRLSLDISARRKETQNFFSSEVQELTTNRQDIARLGFEVEIMGPLALYGHYLQKEWENQEDGNLLFSLLDQHTEETRLGVKYLFPQGVEIGLGVEDIVRDFDAGARNLSHSGTAGFFEASYEGPRFSADLELRAQSLDPRQGSDFAPLDVTTGRASTQWGLHRSAELSVYVRRTLNFSVFGESSHYLEERLGARINVGLQDAQLSLAAEIGQNDFSGLEATAVDRRDDVLALGMSLSFNLARVLYLNVGVIHTDVESPISQMNREITAFRATVQLTSLRERFRFGEPNLIW